MDNPWMKTVTMANPNQNYKLLDLMQAVDAQAPKRCAKLQIQFDVDAGGARLRLGNGDMTDTKYGVLLFATQAFGIELDLNLVFLDQIYLRCDTAARVGTITAVVK